MPNAGHIDDDDIWAYGPDSVAAYRRAQEWAAASGRAISSQNPAQRTMCIDPDGQPAGNYKVFVYTLTPNEAT
jgi:hypothetical protein